MHHLLVSAIMQKAWRYTFFLAFSAALFFATAQVKADPLTLEQAWRTAEQNNPEVKRAIANRVAIQGEITDASGLFYNNPTLNFEGRRRDINQPGRESDLTRGDWGGGVAQTFELAGQQGLRRESSEARLASLEQEIAETYRSVRSQVEEQFVQVLAIQKRIEAEQRILSLIERNTELSKKRVAAGEDSKLDGNLAIVDTERARNQLSVLQEQLTRSRTTLAALLQLPPNELPEAVGALDPASKSYSLNELLMAVESRPAVKALSLRESSARSRLDLERSQRYPDLTVSLNNSREANSTGEDNITTLGFSVPLPIFRRNAAGIGAAMTELAQVEVNREAFIRDAQSAVQAAWLRQQNLRDRVQRLNTEVSPKLEENLRLSQLAFQSGEIGLPQLLIVQRQTIDAQRDLVEALRDLRLTLIEIEYTAGWPVDLSLASQE